MTAVYVDDAFGANGTLLDSAHLNTAAVALSYIITGGLPPTAASLTTTVPLTQVNINLAGVAISVLKPATAITIAANNTDVYLDLTTAGAYVQAAVANGAGAPGVTASAIRLCKIVAGVGVISSVTRMAFATPFGTGEPLGLASLDPQGLVQQKPLLGVRSNAWGQFEGSGSLWTGSQATFADLPNIANFQLLPTPVTITLSVPGHICARITGSLFDATGANNSGVSDVVQLRVKMVGALGGTYYTQGLGFYFNNVGVHCTIAGQLIYPNSAGGLLPADTYTCTLQGIYGGTHNIQLNAAPSTNNDHLCLSIEERA